MSTPVPLDEAAVTQLATEFMICVRNHYFRRPTARATAQESLNAIAIVAATIIAGAREAGEETAAREFFNDAFDAQFARAGEEGLPPTLGDIVRMSFR